MTPEPLNTHGNFTGHQVLMPGNVNMINRKFRALLILAVLLPVAAPAQIYKYTDAKGIVHYTNVKPDDTARITTFDFPCYASDTTCSQVDWEQVPLNTSAYADEIRLAARYYAVESSLIRAIIHAESAYRSDAVSPKGAQGLMQLMPATQQELQVDDPYDPELNILGGAQYLAQLLESYDGDVELAAAAYNAGPGAVRTHQGMPPYDETREYVKRVKILYRRYRLAGA
jgi:soluble lytic murein transglycosylase-like protein